MYIVQYSVLIPSTRHSMYIVQYSVLIPSTRHSMYIVQYSVLIPSTRHSNLHYSVSTPSAELYLLQSLMSSYQWQAVSADQVLSIPNTTLQITNSTHMHLSLDCQFINAVGCILYTDLRHWAVTIITSFTLYLRQCLTVNQTTQSNCFMTNSINFLNINSEAQP